MQAKFIVTAVTEYGGGTHRVELTADPTDSASATNFWGGKGIGRIEMTITKPSTTFTVGGKYDVLFSPSY